MRQIRISSFLRLVALTCTYAACTAGAADFPTKPIQFVLPFGAGATDLLSRVLTTCVSQRFNQSVVVVNKPGASGLLAANIVKAAPPDGYILMMGTSVAVTELVTRKDPEFDVRRDMEPITKIAYGIQGIYVNAQLPINNVTELVAYAKARPGQLNYATAGISSVNHISTEALSQVAGIKMTHVPYPAGTGPLLTALMAGEVQVVLTDTGAAQAALDSGKIRLIGVLLKDRLPSRPNVQAVVEVLPDMEKYLGTLWYGLFAPAKTSNEIIQSIHKSVTGCLNNTEVRTAFKKVGFEESQIVADTPAHFKASIQTDIARLSVLVRERGFEIR